jgi:hypothetical protein
VADICPSSGFPPAGPCRIFPAPCSRASESATSEDFDARAVQSAQATFEAFGRWLLKEAEEATLQP